MAAGEGRLQYAFYLTTLINKSFPQKKKTLKTNKDTTKELQQGKYFICDEIV